MQEKKNRAEKSGYIYGLPVRVHLFFANVKLMERDMVIIQCELGLSAATVQLFFYSGQLVD